MGATEVEEWCSLNLDNVASVTIGQRHTATDTIKQTLVYTGSEKGKLLAFRQLIEKGQLRPPVLVFVQEKDRAKDLFNELIKEKIHVDVIHSERSQLQRDNTVRAFSWSNLGSDLHRTHGKRNRFQGCKFGH